MNVEVTQTRRYLVEFVGGGEHIIEVSSEEDLDIAISEQFTAYGDCEVEAVHDIDELEANIASTRRP